MLVMCPDIEAYAPLVSARSGSPTSSTAAHPGAPAAGAAGRPGAAPDQPAARRRRPAARPGRRPGHRVAGARPGRLAAGAPPVRLRRRRPGAARASWAADVRGPVGARRGAPRGRSSSTAFPQNTWRGRARPAAARRRDGRATSTAWLGRGAAARRRRAAPTSTSPAGSPSSSTGSTRRARRSSPASSRSTAWLGRAGHARSTPDHGAAAPTRGSRRQAPAELAERRAGRGGRARTAGAAGPGRRPRRCSPSGCAGRPTRAELPHRHAHRRARWCRCARCRTGWSACSGSTTGCSRAPRASTATTSWPDDPLVGERDPRSEDRQLLLDAMHGGHRDAGRHLHRRRRAHRARAARRPCRSASCSTPSTTPRATATGAPARDRVVVRHPLQPFDARNFTPARSAAAGRSASTGPRWPAPAPRPAPRSAAAAVPADPLPAPPVRADVGRARRLGRVPRAPGQGVPAAAARTVALRSSEDEPADALPVELTASQHGHRRPAAARSARRHRPRAGCRQAEWRRGVLPPGRARRRASSHDVLDDVEPLVAADGGAARRRARRRSTSPSSCPTAAGCAARSPAARRPRWSRRPTPGSAPKQRLRAWVALLALTRGHPETPWRRGDGRPRRAGSAIARATVGPLGAGRAPAPCWASWSRSTRRGLREPLPLPR